MIVGIFGFRATIYADLDRILRFFGDLYNKHNFRVKIEDLRVLKELRRFCL
jgi:hypothetical protein